MAGRQAVRWDGTDQVGRALPSGVYVARLEAGMRVETVKVVLTR
jgi:flagellar hook assembly protein FlgD